MKIKVSRIFNIDENNKCLHCPFHTRTVDCWGRIDEDCSFPEVCLFKETSKWEQEIINESDN